MRRLLLLLLLGFLITSSCAAVAAQQPALEDGTKADSATAKAVVAAAKTWIDLANAGDATALDGLTENLRTDLGITSIDMLVYTPLKVIKTRDVRLLSDGRLTLEIAFTGGIGQEHQYTNQRWVFVQSGDDYLIDLFAPSTKQPYIAKGWSQEHIAVTLTGGVVALADGTTTVEMEVPNALFINLTSDDLRSIVVLFRLQDGADPAHLTPESVEKIVGQLTSGTPENGFVGLEPGVYVVAEMDFGSGAPVIESGAAPVSITLDPRQATPAAGNGDSTPSAPDEGSGPDTGNQDCSGAADYQDATVANLQSWSDAIGSNTINYFQFSEPAAIHAVADQVRDLAKAQDSVAVPAAATNFNAILVKDFNAGADAMDDMANAVESGDNDAIGAGQDELTAVITDISNGDAATALTDLKNVCSEIDQL